MWLSLKGKERKIGCCLFHCVFFLFSDWLTFRSEAFISLLSGMEARGNMVSKIASSDDQPLSMGPDVCGLCHTFFSVIQKNCNLDRDLEPCS